MTPTLVLLDRGLARHAKKIAARCGCLVVPKRTPNPTLVAHGLVASSRWHILTHAAPRTAVADLYVGTRAEALYIARQLATMLRDKAGQHIAVDLLDNTATPADLRAHPREAATRPKRNPSRTAPSRGDVNRRVADLLAAARTAFERGDKVHAQRLYERAWEVGVGGHVSTNPSRSKAGRYLRAARRGKGRGVPRRAARAQFAAARGGSVAKFKHYMRDSGARYTRRAANPKRRNPKWKTGDRFRLTLPVTLERASYVKGATGTITLAERGNVYAVFDVTPHIAPQPVSSRWIAKTTNRRANPKRPKRIVAGSSSGTRHQGLNTREQALHAERGLRTLGLKTAGVEQRGKRWHVVIVNPRGRANPKGPKSSLPFAVGDVVSISAVQYFGRHGTVVAVGTKLVTVEVHLIGKRVKFAPAYLRLVNGRRVPKWNWTTAGMVPGTKWVDARDCPTAQNPTAHEYAARFASGAAAQRTKVQHLIDAMHVIHDGGDRWLLADVNDRGVLYWRKMSKGRGGAWSAKLYVVPAMRTVADLLRTPNPSPQVRTATNPKGRFTAKEMQTSAVGYYYKHQGESFGPFRTIAERDRHKRASGATVRRVRTLSPLAERLAAKAEHELRTSTGRFAPSSKPVATITQDGTHHYVLTMGDRVMGGDNRAALEKYARAQGFTISRTRNPRGLMSLGEVRRGDIVRFKGHSLRVEEDPHRAGNRVRLSGREDRNGAPYVHRWYFANVQAVVEREASASPNSNPKRRKPTSTCFRAHPGETHHHRGQGFSIYAAGWYRWDARTGQPVGPFASEAACRASTRNPKGRKNPRVALSHPQVPGRASRRSGRAASRSNPLFSEYKEALAHAQQQANQMGRDVGLEAMTQFGRKGYSVFLLPAPRYRQGHELRAEVVSPRTPNRRTRKPTRRIPRGSVRTSPRAPYRRKARPSATGMRRHPNPTAVDQAAKVVRMFQDRGPIPVRRRTVKKPKPLGAAAALIGKVVAVTYDSPKFDGKKRHYEHTFDEPQPLLVADPETQDLSIVRASSRYRLTPDGIVN